MKYKPIIVYWNDACFDEGWVDTDTYKGLTPEDQKVESIGYYMREDTDNLYMCMSKDHNASVISDILVIPIRMITKRLFLVERRDALQAV